MDFHFHNLLFHFGDSTFVAATLEWGGEEGFDNFRGRFVFSANGQRTTTNNFMRAVVRGKEYWLPRTSLVCVENTHNRAGGRVFPQNDVVAVGRAVKDLGLDSKLTTITGIERMPARQGGLLELAQSWWVRFLCGP